MEINLAKEKENLYNENLKKPKLRKEHRTFFKRHEAGAEKCCVIREVGRRQSVLIGPRHHAHMYEIFKQLTQGKQI